MGHDAPLSIEPPPPAPRRVWTIALGAAVLAALVAWGVEEASLVYYGPRMTATSAPRDYRPDLRARMPGEPGGGPPGRPGARGPAGNRSIYGGSRALKAYNQEFTAKAVALSGGAVGAMFGLALGLALGLAGGRSARAWIVGGVSGVVAAALCGAAGWAATNALVPMFYLAISDNPGSPLAIASLLLIRGVPRMIAGLAGGLALSLAVGGSRRVVLRGALGGLIGAAVGVALVVIGDELIALVASDTELATTPILRSPVRRVAAILAVTIPSAAGAAWAILSARGATAKGPPAAE